jgi:multiple antibiotic resistance protein
MIIELLKAFTMMFAVMDPFGVLPTFINLNKGVSNKELKHRAYRAVKYATILLLVFLFFGEKILEFFGISVSSFSIAGGILILIFGLKLVLDFSLDRGRRITEEFKLVPVAMPLIAGPGVFVSAILLVTAYGYLVAVLAALLSLFFTWLILRSSATIMKILGGQGEEIISRIMGLLLMGMAIEIIRGALGVI